MRAKTRWVAMAATMLLVTTASAQQGGLRGGAAAPPAPAPVGTAWLAVGPVAVGEDEEISALVALGPVTVAGKVLGDVTSIGGKVSVMGSGVVTGNITAVCAPVEVAEGARVVGEVRQNELPDMASIAVGWPGTQTGAVSIGETDIQADKGVAQWLVVLGGNVSLRAGAKAGEIVAIGGNVTVEEGAELKAGRAIGGRIIRAQGQANYEDEVMEGMVLPCLGEGAPDSPASRSSQFSISQSTPSMQFRVSSSGGSSAQVDLNAKGERGDLVLSLAMEAVGRFASAADERERYHLGAAEESGPVWTVHYNQFGQPTSGPQEVPAGSDPEFARSAAAGIALQATVTATDERDRRGERTVQIGIPRGAQVLLGIGSGGYGGGAYYGGAYGARGEYGGSEGGRY